MEDAINSVSITEFSKNGIVRIPFLTSAIEKHKDEIIKCFEEKGFSGNLSICGAFDGHGNEFVLYDSNRHDSTAARNWIMNHSFQTDI